MQPRPNHALHGLEVVKRLHTRLVKPVFIAIVLLLAPPFAIGSNPAPPPITVIGLEANSYEVAWSCELTLFRVILQLVGFAIPGARSKAEIRHTLADGTEIKTTYDLDQLVGRNPIGDPKLQPGDTITFVRRKPIAF